jgi:putative intracellular protease/amidase
VPAGGDGGGALVLLYPGCVAYEVMLAVELLARRMPVQVATPDGAEVRSAGIRFAGDVTYRDIRADDVRVALVPGGDCEAVLENADLHGALREIHRRGALIGAICAGPLLLARAGLLAGKRFTHGFKDLHQDFLVPFWRGAHFTDRLVERDVNLVTAKYEGHIDFAVELCLATGEDPADAERWRLAYRGTVR